MRRELPGSVLMYEDEVPHGAAMLMDALFAGGDLMLAQVAHMSGLEPYMIQNWVTRGFLPPPESKRYTRRQLCRIPLSQGCSITYCIKDFCFCTHLF